MNSKAVIRCGSASRKPGVWRKRDAPIPERFQLLLDCRDEAEQRRLYEELAARGVKCRVWVI